MTTLPSLQFFSIIIIIFLTKALARHGYPGCPTDCGHLLHNVTFPFGNIQYPACQNPGFGLICSKGIALWYTNSFRLKPYEVVGITSNEIASGSFVIRSDAMSNCSHVHPAGDLASQRLRLHQLIGAENFSVSQNTIVLIFNCSRKTVSVRDQEFAFSNLGFSYNTSACKAFYTACLENKNLSTTCFETNTIDRGFYFLSTVYGCSSYTSFYNVPSVLPASWPSQEDTGIQLQWVNLYDGDYCISNDWTLYECPILTDTSWGAGRKFAIIGVPILTGILIALICIVCWLRKLKRDSPFLILIATLTAWICTIYQLRKHYRKSWNTDGLAEKPLKYSYSELLIATKSFSSKLGEGGFGTVYKGVLTNGNLIAVKVLNGSSESKKQFVNEVASIGSIHHVNLVRLVGFCSKGSKSILVYEYIENSSLDKQLFEASTVLGWKQRYSIALGTARGLAYLHQGCQKRIIHCDIKPGNILLDRDFGPKIADFGLARLMNRDESQAMTTVRGTPGYVAPEFWSRRDGPVTEKCDVYSFGMLLFELIGGRRNIDLKASISQLYFPEWAFNQVVGRKEEALEELVDKRIDGEEVEMEEVRVVSVVALWCIQEEASLRPRMSKVVQYLEGSAEVAGDPPFPFKSGNNVLVGGHGDSFTCSNNNG